jgi:hypothetical protein
MRRRGLKSLEGQKCLHCKAMGSRQLKLTPPPRFLPNASLAARPGLLPHQVKCYSQVTEPVQLQDFKRLAQLVGPSRVAQLQQCIRHLSSR